MDELKRSSFFYEQFVKEFSEDEKVYFLEMLKSSLKKGYPRCEELYYYLFFMTIKRRIERLSGGYKDGLSAYLLSHGVREVSDMVSYYRERLEERRRRFSGSGMLTRKPCEFIKSRGF